MRDFDDLASRRNQAMRYPVDAKALGLVDCKQVEYDERLKSAGAIYHPTQIQ